MENLAQNEASIELINQLEVSEKNLSNNMNNKDLIKGFLATAESVKKGLKQKYNDLWISPAEKQMMGQQGESTKFQQEEEIEIWKEIASLWRQPPPPQEQ